ncbi:SGNH/GDSL hydrolase family protein [Altericroceibacterium spongiae]|uniref:SGNH/GDSL hydrolase family protein n=1 Tax=Altericroceibacterium spongiae TaxID=2320269 RepID=A0A420ERP8_9SPHN|nr:SGNH/GDSL hydrolase family protein [Altericroceibacterium spongiae]RKF23386.1 SGNH/GDSL hydrolase family protein [Altericroceibacterium spongiae]
MAGELQALVGGQYVEVRLGESTAEAKRQADAARAAAEQAEAARDEAEDIIESVVADTSTFALVTDVISETGYFYNTVGSKIAHPDYQYRKANISSTDTIRYSTFTRGISAAAVTFLDVDENVISIFEIGSGAESYSSGILPAPDGTDSVAINGIAGKSCVLEIQVTANLPDFITKIDYDVENLREWYAPDAQSVENGYYSNNNGQFISNSSYGGIRFAVKPGDTIKVSGSTSGEETNLITLFDINGDYLLSVPETVGTGSNFIYNNYKYKIPEFCYEAAIISRVNVAPSQAVIFGVNPDLLEKIYNAFDAVLNWSGQSSVFDSGNFYGSDGVYRANSSMANRVYEIPAGTTKLRCVTTTRGSVQPMAAYYLDDPDFGAGEATFLSAVNVNGTNDAYQWTYDTSETEVPGTAKFVVINGLKDEAIEAEFLRPSTELVPKSDFAELSNTHFLNMQNSENKLLIIGDSTSMMTYYLKGQGWLQRAQAETDFVIYNYAVSGDNAADQLEDLRNKASKYGSIAASDVGSTLALIILGINDRNDYEEAVFTQNMIALCETLKAMGIQPIISTPWFNGYSADGSERRETPAHLYKQIAESTGAYFVDIYANVRRMLDPVTIRNAVDDLDERFFYRGHCGTRTGSMMTAPVVEFLNTLQKPKTGLKFYRARSALSITNAEDLRFNTDVQRDQLFSELLVGGRYIADADAGYYDDLTPEEDWSTQEVLGEYDLLQSGGSVQMGDWSLIEIVVDCMVSECSSISVDLGVSGLSAYICDVQSGTYPPTSEPQGEMVAATVAGNEISVSGDILKTCGNLDTLYVWVNKTGGFSLQNPEITWVSAKRGKPYMYRNRVLPRARGTEILTQTDGGTATGWTSSGTPYVGLSDVTHLAFGSTGVTRVTDTASISQSFTYLTDGYEDQHAILSIVAAWAPAPFVQGVDIFPEDSAITLDSWPKSFLRLTVTLDAIETVRMVPVAAYSTEIRVPIELPVLVTEGEIKLEGVDSTGIEVARVSLRYAHA